MFQNQKGNFLLHKEYNSQIHNLKNLLELDLNIFVLNGDNDDKLFNIKKLTNSPFSLINTLSGNLTINGITVPADSVSMSAKEWHDWFIRKEVNEQKFYNSSLWKYLKIKGGYDKEKKEFMKIDQKVDKINYEVIKSITNKSLTNNNTKYLFSFDIFEKPTYQIIKITGDNQTKIYESNNIDDIFENFPKSKEDKTKEFYKVSIKNFNFNEKYGNGCNLVDESIYQFRNKF